MVLGGWVGATVKASTKKVPSPAKEHNPENSFAGFAPPLQPPATALAPAGGAERSSVHAQRRHPQRAPPSAGVMSGLAERVATLHRERCVDAWFTGDDDDDELGGRGWPRRRRSDEQQGPEWWAAIAAQLPDE
eukprot:COSAG04_NODE_17896_length_456_cov_1.252101_1_plen_132_part_01